MPKSTYSANLAWIIEALAMKKKTFSKIIEKDCFKTFKNLECLLESWFNQYALGQNILLCSKGFTEKYLFNHSISDDNKKFSKIVE